MKFEITDKELFKNRPRLPEKDKAEWLEALRSGKYKKGEAHLCFNEKYCCLGVLLDIQKVPFKLHSLGLKQYGYNKETDTLPIESPLAEFLDSTGLFVGFRYLHPNGESSTTLASVNDNTKTFKKVISIIEKYF